MFRNFATNEKSSRVVPRMGYHLDFIDALREMRGTLQERDCRARLALQFLTSEQNRVERSRRLS